MIKMISNPNIDPEDMSRYTISVEEDTKKLFETLRMKHIGKNGKFVNQNKFVKVLLKAYLNLKD